MTADLSLSGADASNYTVNPTAATTANITAVTLSVNGVTAANKVYDSTTAATLNVAGASLAGVLSGDVVTLAPEAPAAASPTNWSASARQWR